jgi:predicted transcriptional regulator
MSDSVAASTTQPLVSRIVSSYVKNNHVPPADIPTVINTVYQSLIALGKDLEPEPTRAPAVSIRQSVRPGYVVCLECGVRGQILRHHLRKTHGLSPAQYRAKWELSPDHPITAPAYSEQRSAFAKQIGLGRGATRRRRRRQTKKSA